MIQLTEPEKKWIKLCKNHYEDLYPKTGEWCKTLIPLFKEIYGYDPLEDDNYHSYLNCIFQKLLDIHLKIQEDFSGWNMQLKSIFDAAFYKSISNENELPIERAIHTLCGLIQGVRFLNEDGSKRYDLDPKE